MMTRNPLWLVLALWGAGLGAAAQFGKIAVVFDLASGLWPAAGPTAMGLVVSIVGFVGLIFGTTAGLLLARLGYRRVLVGALLLGAVLSALQALILPLGITLALRAVEGVSHLAIVVAAPVLIAQVTPVARQGLAMTLWSSFFAVTFALLAVLGRPLAQAWGVPVLLLGHAGYMAMFASLLWAMLPPDPKSDHNPLSPTALIGQHGEIYRSASISAPAMGFFCYTMTYVALLTLLPPFVGGTHQAALATSMPLVSIAVSLTLGVWLLGRISAVAAVILGFGIAIGASVVMALFWGHPAVVFAAALVLAGALGLVQGASFASIPQLNATGQDRASAAGAVAQLGNLGTTSGTPILSALLLTWGMAGMVGFVVIFSALGIGLHLWQANRRR